MIGPNLIYPQNHLFTVVILVIAVISKNNAGKNYQQGTYETSHCLIVRQTP